MSILILNLIKCTILMQFFKKKKTKNYLNYNDSQNLLLTFVFYNFMLKIRVNLLLINKIHKVYHIFYSPEKGYI